MVSLFGSLKIPKENILANSLTNNNNFARIWRFRDMEFYQVHPETCTRFVDWMTPAMRIREYKDSNIGDDSKETTSLSPLKFQILRLWMFH